MSQPRYSPIQTEAPTTSPPFAKRSPALPGPTELLGAHGMRITGRRGDHVGDSSTPLSLSPRSRALHSPLRCPPITPFGLPDLWPSGMSGPAARTWPRLQGAERPRVGLPTVPGTSSWGQTARPRGSAHSRTQSSRLPCGLRLILIFLFSYELFCFSSFCENCFGHLVQIVLDL